MSFSHPVAQGFGGVHPTAPPMLPTVSVCVCMQPLKVRIRGISLGLGNACFLIGVQI